jgi:hypothetical protein
MGGKQRKHIWQHNFIGGNLAVTALLGYLPHEKMAKDRLGHACTVEFLGEKKAKKGGIYRMPIKVINSGAGHYLPTGLTYVRQMWLDVTVCDSKGRLIYRSGALDDKGEIDSSAVVYRSVLGKSGDKPEATAFLPEASQVISDRRIRPKGYDIAEFSFDIPADAVGPLSYHAEVRYRSAPQATINGLLGAGAPKLPVFDMGEAKGNIELL